MFTTPSIFDNILIAPISRNADELRIVSGYATSAMAERHLKNVANLKLSVVIGMCPRDGITITNHLGFINLSHLYTDYFQCNYCRGIPVHSKLYVWYSHGVPVEAYIGSANYTQQAFLLNSQHEILSKCDPKEAHEYFLLQKSHSENCLSPNIEKFVQIVKTIHQSITKDPKLLFQPKHNTITTDQNVVVTSVELPLYSTQTNHVPAISGLNWGQREGRDKNQAYIAVPSSIQKSHFFPPIAVHFHVATDDGEMLEMSIAQADGKAIHTPTSNAILGAYLRKRLGVPSGQFVTDEDLERYGRRTITFTKFDDENYFMDMSVK